MRRLATTLTLSVVLVTAALVSQAPTSAAPRACGAGKVARTLDGKRTCVAASTQKALVPAKPTALDLLADGLGPSPVPFALRRKLGDRREWPRVLNPAFTRASNAGAAKLFGSATRMIEASLEERVRARRLDPSFTPGAVSLKEGADGSASVSASATLHEGKRDVTVGLKVEADKDGHIDGVGISLDTDEKGTKASLAIDVKYRSSLPACPTATGEIAGRILITAGIRSGQSLKVGPINVGSVRDNTTVAGTMTLNAKMGRNARLQTISYDVNEKVEVSHSGAALAFLQNRWSVGIAVKGKGKLDPRTGVPLNGGSSEIKTDVRSATLSAAEQAALRESLGKGGDKMLKDVYGMALKALREVEDNARSGACVRIWVDPAPTWKLAPGSTLPTSTLLKTDDGTTVEEVDWTATASLGSVSPKSAFEKNPTFTVTGAGPTGGKTAKVRYEATSVAGIARLDADADDSPFPPVLVGTVAHVRNVGAVGVRIAWTSSVRYEKTTDQTNPDGSRMVLYDLKSATIVNGEYTQTPYPPVCGTATGSVANVAGTVKAGDVEILIGANGGPQTAKILHDVDAGDVTVVPMACPPPPPPFPSFAQPLGPFLNTGAQPFTGFPHAGTNVPYSDAISTGTMTWSLVAPTS